MKSEAKMKPPLPVGKGSSTIFITDKHLGHILVIKQLIGLSNFIALVYSYKPLHNSYAVLYNSSFYMRVRIGLTGYIRNFYVFYLTMVDRNKLFDYKKGNFTGWISIEDRVACRQRAGQSNCIIIAAEFAWRKCKSSQISGRLSWRFYNYNLTTEKEDTLTLIFFHEILESEPGSLKSDPLVISDKALLFFILPAGQYVTVYHYPINRPNNKKYAILRLSSNNMFVPIPGYNLLFGISLTTSYAVHIPCSNLIGKGRMKYYIVLSRVYIQPQIPHSDLHFITDDQLFIKITNFRLCQTKKGILHLIRFYHLV
jgi:hypothetical protein